MADILVTTLPAYPFAFFRIIHHKTSSPVVVLPYWPVYDNADRTALLGYLNGSYKSENGFLGVFVLSGSNIFYQTHASESYGSGLFEVMLLTKTFRLRINDPASFGITGQFYFWSWGIVIDWGDGTSNGYKDGFPANQFSDQPQHTYIATAERIVVFHEDNITVFLCRDPALLDIAGTMSSILHTVAITNSQIGLMDIDMLLRPAINEMKLIEFRNTDHLRLFGVSRPWINLEAFNFRYCNFSRVDVDRMFHELYLVAVACPPVRDRVVYVYAEQSPAAAPTETSLSIRKVMQQQWGWILYHD